MVTRRAAITEVQSAQVPASRGGFFEIHVRGHLNSQWADWLDGLQMQMLDNGEMILAGYVVDQAALMGILNKLYGLNLILLSVSKVEQKE